MQQSLKDDRGCFACGPDNPQGLGLNFTLEGSTVSAHFTPHEHLQGYRGIVHGGIVATVLDEAMAHAAGRIAGKVAATAEFTMRIRQPLLVGQECVARAWVVATRGRMVSCEATLVRASDGVEHAHAQGKLMAEG